MRLWLLVGLAACDRGDDTGTTVEVVALAGDVEVETNTIVLSHDFAGNVVDEQTTDATGQVALAASDLVSVVYMRADAIHVITAPPLLTSELAIHGPGADKSPVIAGAIAITAPAATGPFAIDIGCKTVTVATLPTDIDIPAVCFGTDSNIDVLITTADGTYHAERVPVVDEVAMLDVSGWESDATPVAIDGGGATIAITEIADTFAFAAPNDHALWTGLVVDQTQIAATLDSRITTAFVAGAATAQTFTADDFMPPLTTMLAPNFSWTATGVGDANVLHAVSSTMVWDAVLPPTADHVTFPQSGDVAPPDSATVTLRAIDGPDTETFADVEAAGIWNGTIVPPPTQGLLKEADAH
ncbi:MAG: hypothetical protein QM831_31075 [Kofleriaceae bacterium]